VGLANKHASDVVLPQYGDLLHAGTGDLTAFASTVPGQSSLTGDTTFGYDRKRQLTQQVNTQQGGRTWDYVYDPAGNATSFDSTTRTYNADNQLTGPETYVYDGNGNPTTWQGSSLTFDVENRMTAYGNTLTAGYRGDGLRAWKEGANGRKYFVYDGITVVAELDGDGDLVGTLTHGAAGLLSYNATQYQLNPLGDVAVRLDGSGTVLSYPLFDAWGNPLPAATGEPCGYKARYGYYTDLETGLASAAAGDYAPAPGRLLGRGPAGLSPNQYSAAPFSEGKRGLLYYGRYCGPGKGKIDWGTAPPALDEVDNCCREHDRCFQVDVPGGCGGLWQMYKQGCARCTGRLHRCLARADCATAADPKACRWYRWRARNLYTRHASQNPMCPAALLSADQQAVDVVVETYHQLEEWWSTWPTEPDAFWREIGGQL